MRAVAVLVVALVCVAGIAQGQTVFTISMDGAQAGTGSSFTGSGTVILNQAETQISVSFTHNVPNANVTMAHIHQGAIGVSGPIIFMFVSNGTSPTSETFSISPAEVTTLKNGDYYVNRTFTPSPSAAAKFAGRCCHPSIATATDCRTGWKPIPIPT